MIGASHASVHKWVHALKGIVARVPRKERRMVAIDETKLKIKGRQVFVWAAIDVDTKELIAVYASYYRSHINTIVFVRKVLETCANKPIVLVDGGPWCTHTAEARCLWKHLLNGPEDAEQPRIGH